MKRKMISALLCATMVASMAAGCGSSGNDTSDNGGDKSDSGKKVYAIVTKSAGNPYNEKEAEGFQKVIEAEGGECIVKHPESATADAQVSVIQSLRELILSQSQEMMRTLFRQHLRKLWMQESRFVDLTQR